MEKVYRSKKSSRVRQKVESSRFGSKVKLDRVEPD